MNGERWEQIKEAFWKAVQDGVADEASLSAASGLDQAEQE